MRFGHVFIQLISSQPVPGDLTLANRGREGCVTAAGGRPDARESLVTWPSNPDRPVVRFLLAGLARTLLVACNILLITSTAGGDAALVPAGQDRGGVAICTPLHTGAPRMPERPTPPGPSAVLNLVALHSGPPSAVKWP